MVSTSDLKKIYRKAVAGYKRETDPLKREMYLRASYAAKVDLAARIRFKSATPRIFGFWKRIVSMIAIANQLNKPYPTSGAQLSKEINYENDNKTFDDRSSTRIERIGSDSNSHGFGPGRS